ncbi:MAG: ABC transporter permease [Chloroflexi bacterium]|nr:ABC transporter permease [Chloroflexota bacterium]
MTTYIVRRVLAIIPVLFGISILVFLLVHLIPGDVAQILLGTQATDEQIATLRRTFGLDRPLPVQYLDWLSHIVRGDFGVSFRTNRPVLPDLVSRFGVTIQLTFVSMLIALMVGIPLGVASAANRGRASDGVSRVVALLGLSIPNFWLGTLLILFVSLVLHWLPPVGFVSLFDNPWLGIQTLILPALALGTAVAALVMRMVRSSLLEVLRQDYIRTAHAKGLREQSVLYRHALKNAFIPVLTVIGVQIGYLLGGAVIIESIFSLPGMGRFVLDSISNRDYAIVQGGVLFIALVFCLVNLSVDLVYGWLDPRIRY